MRVSVIFFGLFGLIGLIESTLVARADFFTHHWENYRQSPQSLGLIADFGRYSTNQNYDIDGYLNTPSSLQNYIRFQADAVVTYGLTSRLSGYGRLSWSRIQLDSDTRPGTAFGFNDQTVGLNFQAFGPTNPILGGWLDFQLQLDFPIYNNQASEIDQTPYMGDGSLDLTPGAFFTLPLSQFQLICGMGYTHRTSGFSSAIPWSITTKYSPAQSSGRQGHMIASLSLLGVRSLQNDQNTTSITPSTLAQHSIGTGGSFITNAVNPSLTTLRGSLGYQIAPDLGVSVLYAQPIWGQAAPIGTSISMQVQITTGSKDANREKRDLHPIEMTPEQYGHSNKGFVNYVMEAKVLRANDRLNLVKINKGTQDGVEVGQLFDIFVTKADGKVGEAIARGKVSSVKADEAALTVIEYFKEVLIDEGFIARQPIQ